MRSLRSVLFGTLASLLAWAQDQPPAAAGGAPTAVPLVMENTGKPMLVPFRCSEEDIRSGGLTCSDEDPCQIYRELAVAAAAGPRIFAAGNIHAETATLYSVLL